ncbi:hypothetical protein ABBQ32_005806 [Trebouxia sp. C0010 RCD-2024]
MQIEPLEKACIEYLESKVYRQSADEVFEIALLADHLGLPGLLEDTAMGIVTVEWCDEESGIMAKLAALLQMVPYKQDANKRRDLLHHPQRGAYTELQVLELLDSMGCHEDEILFSLHMEGMPPAELKALLAAIVSRPTDSYQLLQAAVQMLLVPEALRTPPACDSGVIVGDITLNLLNVPKHGTIKLPASKLVLQIVHQVTEGTTSSL